MNSNTPENIHVSELQNNEPQDSRKYSDELDDVKPVGPANSQIQVQEKKNSKRLFSPKFGGQLNTGGSPLLSNVAQITLKNQTGLDSDKLINEAKNEKVQSSLKESLSGKKEENKISSFSNIKPSEQLSNILKPKKKKKVVAKDDSGQGFDITNFRNKVSNRELDKTRINRLQLEEVEEKTLTNSKIIKRQIHDHETTKKTKRKQLSVSQRRSQDKQKKVDLFPERDDNEEFDLHQSLLTLQLYNHAQNKITRKDSSIIPEQNKFRALGTTANLKGMNQVDRNIHQENIAKRVQEYAFGSILNNEDTSDIAAAGIATQNNDHDQKDEEDDGDQDSHLKSVSLDDEDLHQLGKLDMKMTQSINWKMDKLIENVIAEAEEEGDVVNSGPLQNEEYESLGFGQSIWSTDIKSDSKRQFIEAIKQSTENATNSEAPVQNNSNSDQENEFDQISKTIHFETQNKEKNGDHSKNSGVNEKYTHQNTNGFYKNQKSLNYQGIAQLPDTEGNQNIQPINFAIKQQSDQYQIGQFQNQDQTQQQPYYNQIANEQSYQTFQTDVPNQPYVNPQNSNQYDQYYPVQNSLHQAALSSVNQQPGMTSVHSGGVVSGGRLAFTGVSTAAYGDEYPDNQSSNYTHHPLSVIGTQQNQNQNYQKPFDPPIQSQYHNQNQMNAQNRAHHLAINRHINKFMMNPIHKSKTTLNSISMNKFAAIPWRGQNSMNQQANIFSAFQQRDTMMNPQDHYQGNMQGGPFIQTGGGEQNQYQQAQMETGLAGAGGGNNQTLNSTQENTLNNSINQPQNKPIDNQLIKDSQPFYPTNLGIKQEQSNILTQNFQKRPQRVAPIHVPILIPINNKQSGLANKLQKQKQGEKRANENQNKQSMPNERSIFMNEYFGDEKILQKKIELDIKMKQTTQNLESKLIKAVDDNDDDDNDEDEEEDITVDVISGQDPSEYSTERQERSDSNLNKSITINELKNYNNQNFDKLNFNNLRPQARERKNSDQYNINESKEEYRHKKKEEQTQKKKEEQRKMKTYRQEILQNLQKQLADFKNEMFTGDESQGGTRNTSLSPKRSQNDLLNQNSASIAPFKQKGQNQNPQQYMDKVLNLMTMINEIESLNKEAEIKNRMQLQKGQLNKAREERDEIIYQYKQYQQRQILQQKQYHAKLNELNDQILASDEIVANLTKQHEYSGIQIFELKQTIENLVLENSELKNRISQFQEEIQNLFQQTTSRDDEKQQFQNTIYNLSNQINNQIQQLDNNNVTLQQLNQENQKLAQELESKTDQMASKMEEKDKADSDGDELSLEEQLENANGQIRDLQEYIKKKGLEDVKNNQLRQEIFQQNELQHQKRYNELKQANENMEKEKDKIIQYLTEQITQNDVGSSNKHNMQSIDNQSIIEAQSDFTFDENQDFIKSMICQQCVDRKQIIEKHEAEIKNLENKVDDLNQTNQILQKSQVLSSPSKSIKPKLNDKPSYGSDGHSNTSIGNILKASQQILLNNYVRQIKEYLDNIEDQESDVTISMKNKLSEIALKQKITLFDEEEDADSSLVTTELIQKIMSISLDITCELLDEATQPECPPIIHEPKTVFQTVQFGLNFGQLKEIQASGRAERKACHTIIVEIEKLMYDMNSILDQPGVSFENSKEQFGKILATYLQLPLRLKPIFDHSKKIETVLLKSLKSQEEIMKQNEI